MNNLIKYMNIDEFDDIKESKNLYLKCLKLDILLYVIYRNKSAGFGFSYIDHLIRISDNMVSYDGKVLGLLHSIIEDFKNINYDDLIDIGIPNNIVDALKIVTKPSNLSDGSNNVIDTYLSWIDKLIASGNLLAIELKYNDIKDIYNKDRLKLLDRKNQKYFEKKYDLPYKKLKKRMENKEC